MSEKKCLLLIGSPGGRQSSSYRIGNYLFNKIIDKEYIGEKYLLKAVSKMNNGRDDYNDINENQRNDLRNSKRNNSQNIVQFINDIRESDIIILSCPLYVDSIPSFVIAAMENIADDYKKANYDYDGQNERNKQNNTRKEQGFFVIINSGFPESEQNDIAIKICRRFAREVGFKWLGGIGVGGGVAIGNQDLNSKNRMLKNLVVGLDKVSEVVANGNEISKETLSLLNRPLIPKWFYTFILNPAWWFMARKNNAQKKIYDKPYDSHK